MDLVAGQIAVLVPGVRVLVMSLAGGVSGPLLPL